jgi:lipid-A-disaccharide synthase
MSKKIMIVAGEASGDMYGARLVEEAHRLDSSVRFFGIGGPAMRAAGVETLIDSKEMAVVGLIEVIAHFGVIYHAFKTLKNAIRESPPDLLILIDYPGFNLRIASVAKKAGVRILYYITPQVWAWHASRARKIAHLVDHAAVIFPFEVPIFEKEGLSVTFAGHPLIDMAVPTMGREQARSDFGLSQDRRTVGLFPGSRKREITLLLPLMLESAARLKKSYPDLQFILPLASSIDRKLLDPFLADSDIEVLVVEGRNYDVMQVCDAIIAASGTVTMEIALFGIPMVIIYKVAELTYRLGQLLVDLDTYGICNIVAGRKIVQELIQHDVTAEKITAEISRILSDESYASDMRVQLLDVKRKLGEPGAAGRVAALALKMMELPA